jgi:hypothetical protein
VTAPATYPCAGRAMPQPSDAPPAGFVACYLAGHECEFEVTVEVTPAFRYRTARCPCCGDLKWSMGEPLRKPGRPT